MSLGAALVGGNGAGLSTMGADGSHIDLGVQTEEELADLQLQAARKLRQLLSTNRELLIQEVLERVLALVDGWHPGQ